MENNLTKYWQTQKIIALEKFKDGATYSEVKMYLIDKAIESNVDVGYTIRELYTNVTKVTVEAYKEFNGEAFK